MGLYERAVSPLLGRLDAETAHDLTFALLSPVQRVPPALWLARKLYAFQDPRLSFTWRGLTFRNPVGLAAGADKQARLPRFFHAAGMGFIEVGTVTPRPQPGHPRPRMWRLRKEQAMVNRLGFPSAGLEAVAHRLNGLAFPGMPVGVNIGKNASTPIGEAIADYVTCLQRLYHLADYFVANVSSPNTEGLTSLQARASLAALAGALVARRGELAEAIGAPPKPLLVKVSPDLSDAELDDVVEVCVGTGIDGVVAVNTSTDPALRTPASARLAGGLSGRPLLPRALRAVARVRRRAPDGFFIIGVGGVFEAQDAWTLLQAGANAVQMYTGLLYGGPGAVGAINRGLLVRLEAARLPSIADAVG